MFLLVVAHIFLNIASWHLSVTLAMRQTPIQPH